MRIAYHVDQLAFEAPGGIGTYVSELSSALVALEHPPELVTFRSSGLVREGVAPADVTLQAPLRSLYPRWALTGRPALPAGSLAGCDLVHATNHVAVPPARPGQALVVTVHDLAFDAFPETFTPAWRWLYRAAIRAAARRATLLLVPSHATADDLAERYGVGAGRVRVTPLAASLPAAGADPATILERLGIQRPYVLSAATLEPRKNQVRLIRAYRQVAPEVPHTLVLAGPDGWGAADVEMEIERGGPGTVVRTGRLGGEELDAVLRGADAVAYPSLYEGFGLPVVEAMARGVPVIGSTTPAIAETAGDAAVLVDALDVGGLADALAQILKDRTLREELARRGRARASTFSWAATARATLEAYREAADIART